jgi:3-phenylpropionate/trans-cinnamate dioxygenase ferredoxin component
MSAADNFHRLVPAAEIADGRMRCFDLEGATILVCHTRGTYHALDGICTHALARMDEGRLRGFRLICPMHGATFDVRDGKVLGAPATQPLRTYPVRVIDGYIEVAAGGQP